MYVLDPYEGAVIRGWRTSLDDVRQFVFVDEERSYAERTGQANGDMGWIRVLSFQRDRARRCAIARTDRSGSSAAHESEDAPSPSAPRAQAEERAG